MFILRDLLTPLQEEFSNTKQGQKRKVWFAYTAASGGTSVYIINYVQSATCLTYIVWIGDPESAVLYLYGEHNATLERLMDTNVGTNSATSDRGTDYCCTG
jgi:IS1 family transposase